MRRSWRLPLSASSHYYWRWRDKRVFFIGLDATVTDNLDPEDQIFLGGETGMRGYPFHFQSGTSLAQLTVEQRFYTDWYPFRLFNVGAAIFFDAGRTWGPSVAGTPSLGMLRDVGAGLRLGNSRSGFGSVIHLDVAVPLDRTADIDSVQFVVETKGSF
jgi:hemolysin activation/secretion protein